MRRFTKRRKCHARSKASFYCDGCKGMPGKCPMRDKFRDLRNTKYGQEKYNPDAQEDPRYDLPQP